MEQRCYQTLALTTVAVSPSERDYTGTPLWYARKKRPNSSFVVSAGNSWGVADSIYDIEIEQGADFDLIYLYKDSNGSIIDITGYSAKMMIKSGYRSLPLVSLTQASGLTLGGALGTIGIHIPAIKTAQLPGPPQALIYDIFLTDPAGGVHKLVAGVVNLKLAVTI